MSLLPDIDQQAIQGNSVGSVSDSALDALEPRAVGSGTVTISGAVASGDVLTLTLTSKLFTGGTHAVTATAATSDTDAIVAEKLTTSINNDSVLQAMGAYATALAAVVTVHWPGPLGSFVSMSFGATGSEAAALVQIAGGSGPVIALTDARFVVGDGAVITVRKNRRYSFDAYALNQIVSGGMGNTIK
jgi:hypothetical protein